MSDSDENVSTPWEGWVEVGKYPSLDQAQEHALVILAMQEPCWVEATDLPGGFSLHAEEQSVGKISQELLAYDCEQEPPAVVPTVGRKLFRYPAGWGVYALWMMSLVLIFFWQGEDPLLVGRWASSSTGWIDRGEWWRPFTALFLHADAPHLVGNLLSGLWFGTWVARAIGPLRAWALILICGTMGNALTSVLTYPESFVSIGASTAVFGALGILTGIGVASMLRVRIRLPWAKITAPLFAGIILLGWMGGGRQGGNTDVLGHVFGFGVGLCAGLCIGLFTRVTAGAFSSSSGRDA
jgi:membrane associated rhomboid family serine protease